MPKDQLEGQVRIKGLESPSKSMGEMNNRLHGSSGTEKKGGCTDVDGKLTCRCSGQGFAWLRALGPATSSY